MWCGSAIVLTYPAERGGNFSSKYIHSITFIQYIHPSPLAEVALYISSSLVSSMGKPPLGAELGIELGPDLKRYCDENSKG
jgi:hypothetical protein